MTLGSWSTWSCKAASFFSTFELVIGLSSLLQRDGVVRSPLHRLPALSHDLMHDMVTSVDRIRVELAAARRVHHLLALFQV
jgi:hypothetical protein